MLTIDPVKRPSAVEALKIASPWIAAVSPTASDYASNVIGAIPTGAEGAGHFTCPPRGREPANSRLRHPLPALCTPPTSEPFAPHTAAIARSIAASAIPAHGVYHGVYRSLNHSQASQTGQLERPGAQYEDEAADYALAVEEVGIAVEELGIDDEPHVVVEADEDSTGPKTKYRSFCDDLSDDGSPFPSPLLPHRQPARIWRCKA